MKKADSIKLFAVAMFAFVTYIPIAFAEQSTGYLFQKGDHVNKRAPEFSLEGLRGRKVNLKDLCGKPILLQFWTTWCPSCLKDIPKVNELYENYIG